MNGGNTTSDWTVLLIGYNGVLSTEAAPDFTDFKHDFNAMKNCEEFEDSVHISDFFLYRTVLHLLQVGAHKCAVFEV